MTRATKFWPWIVDHELRQPLSAIGMSAANEVLLDVDEDAVV